MTQAIAAARHDSWSARLGTPLDFADEEERALYQKRLGAAFGALACIRAGLAVLELVFLAFLLQASRASEVVAVVARLELGAVVALLVAHIVCRGRLWSRTTLVALDAMTILVVATFAGVALSNAPAGRPTELVMAASFMLFAIVRSAMVPCAPRWTLIVSGIATVPLLGGALSAVRMHVTQGETAIPAWSHVFSLAMWCLVSIVAAASVSRVVYGLRSEIRVASRLGQYTLEKKIGEGGLGIVYRARHALLRRPTAIKLLRAEHLGVASVRRFEREVQATSRLSHPNTVSIFDYGRTRDGVFYYVMELVDGVTLQELVERDGPLPAERVVDILSQIAAALGEAHGLGLVHRDVKPPNVMLCERGGVAGWVKVLDFGLVKEVEQPSTETLLLGTPAYMAPECFLHPDGVDARADVYAFGALAYFLLTGHEVFDGESVATMCKKHLFGAIVTPSERLGAPIPGELENLVMRCLAKARENRPLNGAEIAYELKHFATPMSR
jgi:serine/threonine-protein kinase